MINVTLTNIDNVKIDNDWNFSDDTEMLMHTIHAYPAKFPAFIASKAFEYARQEGVNVKKVADIFCGCGTVALEAKLHNKDFWGCDINPVATLIAKTKSQDYKQDTIDLLYQDIITDFVNSQLPDISFASSNERLQYWFTEKNYNDLYNLLESIKRIAPNGKYREAFLCIFSSILKASSKWLTKSIKPQIDPNKKENDVKKAFETQYKKFIRAICQFEDSEIHKNDLTITNKNFLKVRKLPKVDLIISSPPYVTSYEYADLHQLSTLWLGFADDYREVRKGSIGSAYNSETFKLDLNELNTVGRQIVEDLMLDGKANAKVKAVARYYTDMQQAIHKCSTMLNNAGMAFFVVGDTEYKGVKITNSEHLIQCLTDAGFSDIKVAKRRISRKLLTPYRNENGRFSSDKSQRTIYHEEFIISGRMWHNE